MAKHNNVSVPVNWERDKMAGLDWLRGFRERFPDMSLRKPENCSLARATAFNKETVKKFFDNLENVISRNPAFADGTRIFNLDETATSTVQKNPKVMAPKGRRNICKVSSGEKGTLVTTCNIIGAGGQALPPAIVFPRKNINPRMKIGTPPGSLILASPSGWMNSELFVEVMKHFIQRSASSKNFPSILIMDNHESHLSIEVLDLAKESGVTLLTLHPHTSAKLQPLDVGIYAQFKTFYASAMESWMMRNPGHPVTIYDVGSLIGQAFEKSMTPVNIRKSFMKTGIYPFDRHIFSEDDFMPSSVTDRPEVLEIAGPSTIRGDELKASNEVTIDEDERNVSTEISDIWSRRDVDTPSPSIIDALLESIEHQSTVPTEEAVAEFVGLPSTDEISQVNLLSIPLPLSNLQAAQSSTNRLTSGNTCVSSSATSKIFTPTPLVTPEQFRKPFKAAARSGKRKPRRLGRSLIATDTPEKEEIKSYKKAIKRKKERKAKGKKYVRKVLKSDSEEDGEVMLGDDSADDDNWLDDEENQENIITEELLVNPLTELPREGQYVVVQFASKKQQVFYVAKVLEERNNELEFYVSYLRYRKGQFTMPNAPDLAYVKEDNIKMILPNPTLNGSTARQQSYLTFGVNLNGLNIR
ncbi:uncharacterized protein LOC113238919 [Hyposmocoma kahamanoa]|uniref:uncharacterized protein LOC113238919 n=1 Tax=Hyposmocoma kahamanoa TaxID=1477025 RepID=UPI000E6D7475|nr:uncharacterized protein LOC113238919 [Hyposmocoma kahamanoa]